MVYLVWLQFNIRKQQSNSGFNSLNWDFSKYYVIIWSVFQNQITYVTDALVRHLNLKLLKKEKLQLNTFRELGFKGQEL